MRTSFLSLIMTLCIPCAAFAQEGRLSIHDVVETALQKNLPLRQSLALRDAAEQEAAIQRSRYFPRLWFEEAAAVSNSPTRTFMMKLDQGRFEQNDFQLDTLNSPGSYGDFRTTLQMEVPLFDLSIAKGSALATESLEVRDRSLQRLRQEVAYQVYDLWLEIVRAKQVVLVAEQAVKNAAEHGRLAQVRHGAGTGLRSDELRARTFLSEAEQRKLTAENDLQLARWRLAQTAGMEAGSSPDISEPLVPLPVVTDVDELVRYAVRQRSDLKAGEKEVERAVTGVTLARSGYLPTLYGSASYQLNDRDVPFSRDNDSWNAGLSLRWEIFDGFRRGRDVSRAGAFLRAAEASVEHQRREIELQVREGVLRREEAAKRLEVARRGVEDAEEAVRLIGKRYENSLATMVELLDAQTSLDRSRAQLVENETALARASARLLHAAGLFLQEVMK